MLELAFYLLGALALTGAFQGLRMLAAGAVGESRHWARRLSRGAVARRVAKPPIKGGWLQQELETHAPFIQQRLTAAGARFRSDQLVTGAAVSSALVMLGGHVLAQSLLAPLILGIAAGLGGPVLLVAAMTGRRRKRFLTQMPQTVDLIARSLQAGHPVTTAITVAGRQMPDPIGPELAAVIAEMNLGLDRNEAFRNLLVRFPLPELRLLVASLEVTRETGGNIAEVLLKLSDTMRAKAQLRKKIHAISAEGRLTLIVVSALPPLVAFGISSFRPGYYSDVASEPLFWPLMSAPPLLVLLGALIIWRLINFRI